MLSLNEIRDRALCFTKDHAEDGYERGETQKFWIDFFGLMEKSGVVFCERGEEVRRRKATGIPQENEGRFSLVIMREFRSFQEGN